MCLLEVPVPGVVYKNIKVLKSTRPNYRVSHNWSAVTLSGFGQFDVNSLKATTRLSLLFPALQWFWKDKLTAVHHVINWCKTWFFFLISFPPFWSVVRGELTLQLMQHDIRLQRDMLEHVSIIPATNSFPENFNRCDDVDCPSPCTGRLYHCSLCSRNERQPLPKECKLREHFRKTHWNHKIVHEGEQPKCSIGVTAFLGLFLIPLTWTLLTSPIAFLNDL